MSLQKRCRGFEIFEMQREGKKSNHHVWVCADLSLVLCTISPYSFSQHSLSIPNHIWTDTMSLICSARSVCPSGALSLPASIFLAIWLQMFETSIRFFLFRFHLWPSLSLTLHLCVLGLGSLVGWWLLGRELTISFSLTQLFSKWVSALDSQKILVLSSLQPKSFRFYSHFLPLTTGFHTYAASDHTYGNGREGRRRAL